ncbi:MAG: hypothetical protein HKN92_08345, partial [Chitinophagales bacterium]|nr:hypothetical protein [Chitinophagales bacterium]
MLCGLSTIVTAQTSWIGSTNNKWKTSSNWTAGVPDASTDAIIGDANFAGPHHPDLSNNGQCNNLTIGNGVDSLTLTISKNLTVNGSILIGPEGVVNASKKNRTITVVGNWTNNGAYNATTSDAIVSFSGNNQSITGETTFEKIRINSSSTLTLNSNITVNNIMDVYGTFIPTYNYQVGGIGDLIVLPSGELKVYTANFTDNYPISGSVDLDYNSIVNYASDSITQYISSALTYGWLRISGGSTKELTANLPNLQSTTTNAGRIYVDAGTFDLKTFTADRAAGAGGSFILGAATTLRIGGTNGFPSNYNSKSISTTSTVEYYGNNQTVDLINYGNLTLSGTSGSVVKTMPITAFIVYGFFTAQQGSADSVSISLGNSIDVRKDVTLGSNVTFSGGSYSHIFWSDWINTGRFKGETSTCIFRGVGSNLSGNGFHNFNELHFISGEITADSAALIKVKGDLKTYSGGAYTHSNGGTLMMTGSSKQISGSGFSFYHLDISGTITTSNSLNVRANFNSTGSFSANSGAVNMLGNNKLIQGSGTISFSGLNIFRNIDAQNDFSITSNWFISSDGSFQMPSGNITFDGSTTLSGIADIDSLTINATKTLIMGSSSRLGVAGSFISNGTFDVATFPPNTIEYNASGNQTINATAYHHLTLSTGGTKTMEGNVTVRGNIKINSGASVDGATYTTVVYKDWINEGTFIPSTSNVSFESNNISNVTGATTFYDFTINKSTSEGYAYLQSDVTTSHINMTLGVLDTDTNSITTTIDRTGGGYIYGTVTHSHSFSDATAYYFESPYTSVTFNTPSGITSVSIKCTIGEVSDFDPNIESVDRQYEISVNSGTYTDADVQFHYLDAELNAFEEPFLAFYKFNTGTTWDSLGFTSRNLAQDWVQYDNMTGIPGRYSLSGIRRVLQWNGSVNTAWENASNWTTLSGSDMSNRVPNPDDAVKIGTVTFTNQPTVNQPQVIAALKFGSDKGVDLTLLDSLTINGSFKPSWDTTRTHNIDISSAFLHIVRTCRLSDGVSGNNIELDITTGHLIVGGTLTQSAESEINLTSGGKISLAGDYNYTEGVFNAVSGTFEYNGDKLQYTASVPYDNLSFAKVNGIAVINAATTVSGNLNTSVGGLLRIIDTLDIGGSVTFGSST